MKGQEEMCSYGKGNQADWERGRERQPELFRESIWRLASSSVGIMFSWLFVDH